MTHLTLPNAGCRLLGLVPAGPVEPGVYGLVPVQRRHGGWLFRVTEPWRLAVVAQKLRCTRVGVGASQTRRAVLERVGVALLG